MSRARAQTPIVALSQAGSLLLVSSAVRALDGGGLLPGVREGSQVRAAVSDPRILLLWIPVALVAGAASAAAAAHSRRRRASRATPWVLTAVAFPAMFSISETAAHAGASLRWEEIGSPVLLQVALATAVVLSGRSLRSALTTLSQPITMTLRLEALWHEVRTVLVGSRPVTARGRGPPHWRRVVPFPSI